MCEWMSQNTGTMPGLIEEHGAGLARLVAAQIEGPRRARARTRCETCMSLLGKSTVVPTVIASTRGTNCSPRWSMPRPAGAQLVERRQRPRLQIHDRPAAIHGVVPRGRWDRRPSAAPSAGASRQIDSRPRMVAGRPPRPPSRLRPRAQQRGERAGGPRHARSEPVEDLRGRVAALVDAARRAPVVLPARRAVRGAA